MNSTFNYYSETLLADRLNPINIYLSLRDQYENCCLLESSDYQASKKSKSFIAVNKIAGFEAFQLEVNEQLTGKNRSYTIAEATQLPEAFEAFRNKLKAKLGQHYNHALLFGYHSFEAYSYFEEIDLFRPGSAIPDFTYSLFEFILVFDHFKNELEIRFFYPAEITKDQVSKKINHLKSLLFSIPKPTFPFIPQGNEQSDLSDEDFKIMVEKGIQHCKRGDVFQVVLSRCFTQEYQGDEFNLYRAIRSINPSPYLFYYDLGNFRLLGSSPEAALQYTDGKASINPIAGTVKRTGNDIEDSSLAEKLAQDPKEIAEHMMLLDLARNDLSKTGSSIEIEEQSQLQYFSHVIHLVSTVSAKIDENTPVSKIIGNCFPAGTLSGAPKFRAAQIIKEQEKQARGFYGGSIGIIGIDDTVNQAITIRSVLCKDGSLRYQAGAGVLEKSTPQAELEEVEHKLGAVRAAIKLAKSL